MLACLPAARLFIIRYMPHFKNAFQPRTSRLTELDSTELYKRPGDAELGTMRGTDIDRADDITRVEGQISNVGGSCGENAKKGSDLPTSLDCTNLDRYRPYSVHVSVTSDRRFMSEDAILQSTELRIEEHHGDDCTSKSSLTDHAPEPQP